MKEHRRLANQLEPTFDSDGVQVSSGLDAQGRELPDPVPMSPPVGYSPPSDLEAMILRVIHNRELMAAIAREGGETFEEGDDFDVGDEDYDPRFEPTIYEEYFEAKTRRKAADAAAGGREGGQAPPPSIGYQ